MKRLLHISTIDGSKITAKFPKDEDAENFKAQFKDRYFFEIGPVSYMLTKFNLYTLAMLFHRY